jgi:FecR protein
MLTRHVSDRLLAYIEEGRDANVIEPHLAECESCRAEYGRLQAGRTALERLPLVEAPNAIWNSIESALDASPRRQAFPFRKLGLAGIAAVIVAVCGYWLYLRSTVRWEVNGLSGSPLIGARHVSQVGQVTAGEWVETDAGARARIKIGEIGTVELAPNTRARVVATRPREHRIALAHGEIHAEISAPPKLFFVDTAAGTAVDLGCEYSLYTDEDGSGLMRVTKGWVSFQFNGHEALVPAGASCRTYSHAGPGTPYFDDASDNLKRALDTFDQTSHADSLSAILSASHVRDTLTLWHLLSRVAAADRGRVYDRIAALTPVPAEISREKVLDLDSETLSHWKDELAWTW